MNRIHTTALMVAGGIVMKMNISHQGYEKYWWWDNISHLVSGFLLGMLLPEGKERQYYYVIAAFWEAFEWKLASMKLYELHELIPEGPRSMGYEGWTLDHQIEDTILDTIMGDLGVKSAQKLKRIT